MNRRVTLGIDAIIGDLIAPIPNTEESGKTDAPAT